MWLEAEEVKSSFRTWVWRRMARSHFLHTKKKIKGDSKWYNLSRHQGQLGVKLGYKWKRSSGLMPLSLISLDFIFFHFYFISLLKFMKVYFISLHHIILFLGTFLAQKFILCLFPGYQSGFIAKPWLGLLEPMPCPLYALRSFLHIKLAMNTLAT